MASPSSSLLCILRYLEAATEKKCPVCAEMVSRPGLRRVLACRDLCSDQAAQGLVLDGVATNIITSDLVDYSSEEGTDAGAYRLPDIREGSMHAFQHIVLGPALTVFPAGQFSDLQPLSIDIQTSCPRYGDTSCVYSRICAISGEQIISELNAIIDELSRHRSACIQEHGGPSTAVLAQKQPKPYAAVAAGIQLLQSKATEEEVSPCSAALQEQLSLISEAMHAHQQRIAWVQAKMATCNRSVKPPPLPVSSAPAKSFSFKHSIFQSITGLDVFIHPSCCCVLDAIASEHCSIATASCNKGPAWLVGRVKFVEHILVTEKIRQKYRRQLQQIPLHSRISFVYIDMIEVLWSILAQQSPEFFSGSPPKTEKVRLLRSSPKINRIPLDNYIQEMSRCERIFCKKSSSTEEQELMDLRCAMSYLQCFLF